MNFICAKPSRTTVAYVLTFNSINRQTTGPFDTHSQEMHVFNQKLEFINGNRQIIALFDDHFL